jgi:hypothetical protein
MKLYKAEGYSGCFANYEEDFQEMNYLKNAYDARVGQMKRKCE